MELKEQVFKIVFRATQDETGDFSASDAADAILALPEIREALELKAHRDTRVGYERQG